MTKSITTVMVNDYSLLVSGWKQY